MMIYLHLFLSFLYIGLFTVGGGYAALPLIYEQTVNSRGWLTVSEYADLITISEITPGPIAINSATFVGMKVAGIPGAIIATAGFLAIPFLIISILYAIYRRYRDLSLMQGILSGLRPAVVALIASAGLSIIILALWEGDINSNVNLLSVVLISASLFCLRKWKPNPILIIFGCGIVSILSKVFSDILISG